MRSGGTAHGLAGDRLPCADCRDIPRAEHLRGFIGLGINQFHVAFTLSNLFQPIEQQEMFDETNLDTDLLALQFLNLTAS
jgi:hypothetical protein